MIDLTIDIWHLNMAHTVHGDSLSTVDEMPGKQG